MQLGVAITDTWDFFHEIYAEFQAHHRVSLFAPRTFRLPVFNTRVNRVLFQQDLAAFLKANDVVFFEWSSDLLAAATQLPKTCGIVTRMHRFEMYQWADKVDWTKVDRLILVSHAKRQEFLERFPAHEMITAVLPEAINLGKFHFQPKPFGGNLGILCHLRPRKRVYETILAFAELCRERDDLHLHIGGGGAEGFHEYPIALHQLVARLGLQAKITFYGNVTDNAAWYQNIDVFISNAYSEGWQVSLLEAMASGWYCLAHQWAGADELLPPENLYVTDREFQQSVLAYTALPESERQQRLVCLRQIVEQHADMAQTQVKIRQIVEAVANQKAAGEN